MRGLGLSIRTLLGLVASAAILVTAERAYAAEAQSGEALAEIWVLICAALVFLMQSGFLAFEVGLVRQKNATVTALKNLADWIVVGLFFYAAGFGLMFGESVEGLVGKNLFAAVGLETAEGSAGNSVHLSGSFLLFQLAFCGTAMTIVSGAVAERTGLTAYLVFGVVMAVLIYPLFGHWVWSGLYLGEANQGWLAQLGYHDFAGSSVVHGVGAWSALAAIQVIGPRMGRYGSDGKLTPLSSHGLHWSAFGTLILWFCWWGFNGGSALAFNADVPRIILNTNLSGAAAATMGLLHGTLIQKRRHLEEKFLGATLSGLVAITACADIVPTPAALAVGAGAAVVHNHAFEWVLIKWRLDDVVGAVPVHGFAGVWGCLCVALFGKADALANERWTQLGIQALGCLVCFVWAYSLSFLAFRVLRAVVGVRVDPLKEIQGLSLNAEEPDALQDGAEDGEQIDQDELLAQIREQFDEDERFDRY